MGKTLLTARSSKRRTRCELRAVLTLKRAKASALARHLEVSAQTIRNWQDGMVPASVELMLKAARALGVHPRRIWPDLDWPE